VDLRADHLKETRQSDDERAQGEYANENHLERFRTRARHWTVQQFLYTFEAGCSHDAEDAANSSAEARSATAKF
jgi:hypothetical protein